MQVHAFVLHLTRAADRRDNAHALKNMLGPASEIWPAVDGSALSSQDLATGVGSLLFDPSYPFALKPGEIGCFLSHRQIWADLQMRDADAALIVEDDASIDPGPFHEAAIMAQAHIRELGYIQFQTRPATGPSILIDSAGPSHLIVPQQAGLRTTAQLVSKEAAAHLLHLSDPIDRPVDTFVQSHWHTGLRPAMIYPSGVSEDDGGSTIQAGKKPILEKLTREISRVRYRKAVTRLSRQSPAPAKGGLSSGE